MAHFVKKKINENAKEVTYQFAWTSTDTTGENQAPELVVSLAGLEANSNGDACTNLIIKEVCYANNLIHNSVGTPYHSNTNAVYLMSQDIANNNKKVLLRVDGIGNGKINFEGYGGLLTSKDGGALNGSNGDIYIACGGEFNSSALTALSSSDWDQVTAGGGYNIIVKFQKLYN